MSNTYKSRKYDVNDEGYIQYPDKLEELRDIFSKIKTKDDKPLRKLTITNYVNKLNKLSIMITGHGYKDNKFLLNIDKIIEALDKSGLKSQKDYLSPVVKLLQYLDTNANKSNIKNINEKMTSFKKAEDNKRNDNLASIKEKQNAISLNDIEKHITNYKSTNKFQLMNLFIVLLYFDNELIARNNYYNIKLASSTKKIRDLNPNYNYMILDRNKIPIAIYMLNYKTSAKYGLVKFQIKSHRLQKIAIQYMNEFNKQPGDLLFTDKYGNEYKSNSFSEVIKNAMNDVLKKPLNIDLIRKIHITEFYKDGLHSENQKILFAKRFLHDVEKQKEYMKVDLFSDNSDDNE